VIRTLLVAALLALALAPSALASPPKASTSIDTQAQCTGTVIAPQWIVSAAHCAFRPDGQGVDGMVTLTGVGDLNDPAGEAIVADRLVVHPDWDPDSLTGDALLIHLGSPSSASPHAVAQPGGRYYTQPNVPNAAGWGATDEKAEIGTELLKEAYLEIQDDDTCAFCARGFDAATQTCAGTKDTAGACKGDSGGPLIVFDEATDAPVLFGLTSYGPQIGLGQNVCALKAPAVTVTVLKKQGRRYQPLSPTLPLAANAARPIAVAFRIER
jgi:secreted trypsin-like serine protease